MQRFKPLCSVGVSFRRQHLAPSAGHDGTERVSTPGRSAERGTFEKKKNKRKRTEKREKKNKKLWGIPRL